MIANYLGRLTFRQKLQLSFAGMMLLIAINAVVANLIMLSVSQQMEYCSRIERVIRIVNQVNIAVNHFSRTHSREHANQVYALLETIHAWLKDRGRIEFELSRTGLNSQLDLFRVKFQQFVIQRDQMAALENSSITLGRNLVNTLATMRTNHIGLSNSNELTNIISQVLNIQWQGQEFALTNTLPAAARLRTITEQLMTDAEHAHNMPRTDNSEHRAFFRMMRDARDYVTMFERFIQQSIQTLQTEKELLTLSDEVYQMSVTLENQSRQHIRQRIFNANLMMIVMFGLSLVAAQKLKNFLFVQITTPISRLVGVTKHIASGARSVRAVIDVKDEIGELADSINQMTDSLQQSEDALWHANQTLEQRIRERTEELMESNRQLAALTRTDGLTNIANRRYFDEVLHREHARHIRSGAPLSLILLDVDYFKFYNDHYGHARGDECLRQVAQLLTQSVTRTADFVARYGGEEFVCILPDTPLSGAIIIAETIRQAIIAAAIPHQFSQAAHCVTVSLGVISAHCDSSVSAMLLLNSADRQLYRAKEKGRNCVASEAIELPVINRPTEWLISGTD